MGTSISSKRPFATIAGKEKMGGTAVSIISFVVGVVLMAIGIKENITFLAGVGFIGFVGALMYWNAIFWAKVLKDKTVGKSFRYYPY